VFSVLALFLLTFAPPVIMAQSLGIGIVSWGRVNTMFFLPKNKGLNNVKTYICGRSPPGGNKGGGG
jgi:hypothetical protein